MAKQKKLSKSQTRRIKANQSKRLAKAKRANNDVEDVNIDDSLLGGQEFGRIITRYGMHADVEVQKRNVTEQDGSKVLTEQFDQVSDDNNVEIIRCNIRRAVDSLVCGDIVVWRPYKVNNEDFQGVIEAVEPRTSEFVRPDFYDGLKPVAANIDQILIVSALLPDLTPNIIDRYLVAVEQLHIRPIILINKMDLLDETNKDLLEETVKLYTDIGYQVVTLSAKEEEGIEQIQALLKDHVSVFVGQSGVGKSSLVNAILPDVNIETKQVSENSRLGQHTTTASRFYRLQNGGAVIDSPGVREFAMWHLSKDEILAGFVEFSDFVGLCKFRDCSHKNDPGCALKQAVSDGKVSDIRYQSYLRILQTVDDITLRHQPKDEK
ncbi:small ribosomal subunit biogenesis GTPase RsgA [Psychrosphaera ytuae]|uniref:Small ribosomal subunit biogenesis GTPase RsgA n=1 Tax=Psychrosphaera ytuae TaxID=2820710 RepID=A0A975HH35_9GAMM|nr:small ribosomal subunit biogenesis GTPase RsgA [Psychrosphaera ytuae]QTH62685.1 small ribosomal subunit biogenesis GTPase RsgA [Psychrosphaera ytuae]